nr:immunoglobulin heavy chain junction region [Mus musculus]MBK4185371.1 immunoglobulin heavy chain junction region [Mus musculus]
CARLPYYYGPYYAMDYW